jgi:hypothetical protein
MLGSRLACGSRRLAATKSEFLLPKTCAPKTGTTLTPFFGTEDIALSCFAVQDLVKKMLDKNEARL